MTVCPRGMTKQRIRARPKPRNAQSAPLGACRHLARMTTQATRQIISLGRYAANMERNVLIWSVLFIMYGGLYKRDCWIQHQWNGSWLAMRPQKSSSALGGSKPIEG